MTQPVVLWDAVCTARENKFLRQVYRPGEEGEPETCSGREGGPGPLPSQGPCARVGWVSQAEQDGG